MVKHTHIVTSAYFPSHCRTTVNTTVEQKYQISANLLTDYNTELQNAEVSLDHSGLKGYQVKVMISVLRSYDHTTERKKMSKTLGIQVLYTLSLGHSIDPYLAALTYTK